MGLDRFLVKRGGRSMLVNAQDVDWIESDGNYVSLHVGPQSHLVRGTLASCADKLDPQRFIRIHRRFIVNVERVKEIQPWFGGDYIVLLHNGHRLRLSRNFREQFQKLLGPGVLTSRPPKAESAADATVGRTVSSE